MEIGRIPGEEVAGDEGPVGERHEGGECYPLGCLARAGLAGGEPSAEQELRRRRLAAAAAVRRAWAASSRSGSTGERQGS